MIVDICVLCVLNRKSCVIYSIWLFFKDHDLIDVEAGASKGTSKPSSLSYLPYQLKRKPLSSIFYTQTPSSSIFQPRSTSTVQSQRSSSLSGIAHSGIPTYTTQPGPSVTSTRPTTTSDTSLVTKSSQRSHPVASSTPGFSVSTFVTPLVSDMVSCYSSYVN